MLVISVPYISLQLVMLVISVPYISLQLVMLVICSLHFIATGYACDCLTFHCNCYACD